MFTVPLFSGHLHAVEVDGEDVRKCQTPSAKRDFTVTQNLTHMRDTFAHGAKSSVPRAPGQCPLSGTM